MRVIVIPAYREARVIGPVVREAVAVADAVVVVDDGSPDDTAERAKAAGALVVRHPINRGVGAALGTGIEAARRLGATLICTMDADGQHQASDVARVFERLSRGDVDLVLGSRMFPGPERRQMPRHRVALNKLGNLLTWMLFGVWVTDSQSGLRGLTRAAADVIDLRTNGFESLSEFVYEIRRHGWRFDEIPIAVIYSDYSLSKGQSVGGGFRTAARLMARRFLG